MPSPRLHPADALAAGKESTCVVDSIESLLDERAMLSVNSVQGHYRARQKPLQLRIATEAGLAIPETLVSNDPGEIRAFARDFRGRVVLKSFTSPTWKAEGSSFFPFTRRIAPALLEDDEALSAAPAIYQSEVAKRFEVRAFFAGATCLAASIDSQSNDSGVDDWRRAGSRNMRIRPHRLPRDVEDRCRQVMARLGIVTGSFDFAVDEHGNYVFFEVNEQGQFLWLEQRCPEIPVLEAFAGFLSSSDPEFMAPAPRGDVALGEFARGCDWERMQAKERDTHLMVEMRAPYQE
jgi:hypothetical protein